MAARLARGGMLWAGWRPGGAVALTGRGAVGLDRRRGTLSGLGWGRLSPRPPLMCCPASPGWPPVVLGRRGHARPGERGLGARRGQRSTTRRCLSVVPEPGRLGSEGEGAAVRAAAATTSAPPAKPQCPGQAGMEAAGDTGALPQRGCRSPSHVGGPGVRETMAPSSAN